MINLPCWHATFIAPRLAVSRPRKRQAVPRRSPRASSCCSPWNSGVSIARRLTSATTGRCTRPPCCAPSSVSKPPRCRFKGTKSNPQSLLLTRSAPRTPTSRDQSTYSSSSAPRISGSLSARIAPAATSSGTSKPYRPSIWICPNFSGERCATALTIHAV